VPAPAALATAALVRADPPHRGRRALPFAQEFAGDDNQALFTEETEAELARKRQQELEQAMAIPGMIRPQDRPDYNMGD